MMAPQSVRIKGRGCVPLDITARRKNNIGGKVLDANGNPMKYVPVSLVSADLLQMRFFPKITIIRHML